MVKQELFRHIAQEFRNQRRNAESAKAVFEERTRDEFAESTGSSDIGFLNDER